MTSLTAKTYAYQTRSIVNKARVNEDPKARLIRGELSAQQISFNSSFSNNTFKMLINCVFLEAMLFIYQ